MYNVLPSFAYFQRINLAHMMRFELYEEGAPQLVVRMSQNDTVLSDLPPYLKASCVLSFLLPTTLPFRRQVYEFGVGPAISA
jgi:hypothetical protein